MYLLPKHPCMFAHNPCPNRNIPPTCFPTYMHCSSNTKKVQFHFSATPFCCGCEEPTDGFFGGTGRGLKATESR